MADVTLWQDKRVRADFEARARALLEDLLPRLEGQTGIVAIEPESGDYFIGSTLGKANQAAFAKYPDRWLYFVRLDDHLSAIALPTW